MAVCSYYAVFALAKTNLIYGKFFKSLSSIEEDYSTDLFSFSNSVFENWAHIGRVFFETELITRGEVLLYVVGF